MSNYNQQGDQSNDTHVIYLNTFRIGYDAYKFLLDFGITCPDPITSKYQSRVVMAPSCAKVFYEKFGQAVRNYEFENGSVNKEIESD